MNRKALISVSDKLGLDFLGRGLQELGCWEILSTGGTARALRAFGVPVTEVAEYTGSPEILDGRVKTLHPRVHGGLLGRPTPEHRAEMAQHNIEGIDLLVVNLYPFEQTLAKPGATAEEILENIDVGGPSMLRSAKNYERVTVVCDPHDYPRVLDQLRNNGDTSLKLRHQLARKAFHLMSYYDGVIADNLPLLP